MSVQQKEQLDPQRPGRLRVRWAAIGAAVAVTLGAGTIVTVDAVQTSGERLTYVATEPCRLIDTRPEAQFNVGPRTTPLGPTETITIDAQGAQGQCTAAQLPTDAAALALNVTVPTATANGFLTIWGDGDRPNASSLNPAPNQPPTPNAVTVTRAPGGTFNVYNENGFTHLIIDIVGHHLDHNHDDRYYTKDQIDQRSPQEKTISFVAAGLNYGTVAAISRDSGGSGIRWENSFIGSAAIEIMRPDDWDGVSDVTLQIDYFRTTGTPGLVQFLVRPDSQNPGDDVDVGAGFNTSAGAAAGADLRRRAEVVIPAANLNQGDVWKITIQRQVPATFPYSGDVIVSSMSLTYQSAS